jgi:hypothetical protein
MSFQNRKCYLSVGCVSMHAKGFLGDHLVTLHNWSTLVLISC